MRQLNNLGLACFFCLFWAASAIVLPAQVTVTSNVAIGGPSPWYDVSVVGVVPGTLSSANMTALTNLISTCSTSGGTIFFPPSATPYTLPSQLVVSGGSAPCVLTTWSGNAILQKGYNAQASNNYTGNGPGYITVTASNVTLRNLSFDGNEQSVGSGCPSSPQCTGANIAFVGNIANDMVDGITITNCDGPCVLNIAATAAGGQGPINFTLRNSTIVAGPNSTTTAAGGPISARDQFSNHQYVNNYVDAHLNGYAGSAAFEIECGNSTAATATILCTQINIQGNYIISSCNSGNVAGGGGWGIQAGAFSALAMTGLKIVGNDLHLWCDSNGLISVPSTDGTVIANNHIYTHYADLISTGSNGQTINSIDTFQDSTFNKFLNSNFGNVMGRTLAYLCGTVWNFTLISSWTNSSTIVPLTTPTCTSGAANETWVLYGYSPSFAAIELGNSTGPTVTGNTIYGEGSEQSSDVWGDSTSGAQVTGNSLYGWGEGQLGSAADACGICFNAGFSQNSVTSVTQTGYLATISTSPTSLIGQIQAGMKIALCDTTLPFSAAAPSCTPHAANGLTYGIYQIYEVPLNGGTSFIINYPINNTSAQPVTLCTTCNAVTEYYRSQ